MGNPRRVSRIPPDAIQGDRRTRDKLPRTTSRTDRRGGRMGSRTDPRKAPLRPRKEIAISRKMEGLLARSRSMGRQVRHHGRRTRGDIRTRKQRRAPTSKEYKNPEEKSKRSHPLSSSLPQQQLLSSINVQKCQSHQLSTSAH